MGKIEIILIVAIICVIVIDFFYQKKREKIDLNLIGDKKIKFSGQSKFYFIIKYLKKYFYKLFLSLFFISLIITNPTKRQFLFFAQDANYNKKTHKYFLKYNFFVFSIHQENIYRRSTVILSSGSRSRNGTVTKNIHIGVFNSFFLVSEDEERYTY